MPLRWEKGKNPFVHNYFGILHVGANTPPAQIVAQARELKTKLDAGKEVTSVAGTALDEFAINDASQNLLEAASRAEEMLLAHRQPPRGVNKSEVQKLCKALTEATELPEDDSTLPLRDATSLFWFVPQPGVDLFDLPDWRELCLEDEHSEADQLLDVVFDV